MNTFYHRTGDGTRYRVAFLALDDYEADGGRYDDSGNGGENMLATGDPEEAVATYCWSCGQTTHEVTPGRCPRCYHDLSDVLMPYLLDPASIFVCAIRVEERQDDSEDWSPAEDWLAVERAIGIPENALWHDSATSWHLLRDWPAEAPLEARMVNS